MVAPQNSNINPPKMHVPVPKVLRSSKYSNRKYNPFLSPPFSAFPKVVVRTGMTMDSATGLRLSRPIPGGPRSVFTEVPPHAESASASSSRMIAVPKQSNNPEPREEIPYLEPLHVERQDSPMDGSYLKDDETPFPIPPVEMPPEMETQYWQTGLFHPLNMQAMLRAMYAIPKRWLTSQWKVFQE